jgi:protease-4
MSEQGTKRERARGIRTILAAWWNALGCLWMNGRRALRRSSLPDYPVITLEGRIVERAPHQPWWANLLPSMRKPPMSLESLHDALRAIAGDPDTRGVVFFFKSPELTLAQAQSFTALLARFRAWDQQYNGDRARRSAKKVIVHIEDAPPAAYVAACAADAVYMTPLTDWPVVGLRVGSTYLKETLAQAGISFDVVKVAPWKSASDPVSRAHMSAESREQYNWLLDSLYGDIVRTISRGRKLSEERVRTLVDAAPLTADAALAADLVDGVVYEDELPLMLGEAGEKALLKPYARVAKLMLRHPQVRPRQRVGVISLEGAIVTGTSRRLPVPLPLLGDRQIGSRTVQQQVRAARADQRLAAVILHVDSPGGSALASDLIWRELELLNSEKPLVVYMGDVAASGGYYVATPSRKIVAQSATLTGSIGVLNVKPNTRDTYRKLNANVETIQRGDNAAIYATDREWNPEQRQKVEQSVQYVYAEFKERVADGRALKYEALDPICNGRVWTGAQACAYGLVDELGDFSLAVKRACELAELPTDGSVRLASVQPPKSTQLAAPFADLTEPEEITTLREWGQLAVDLVRGDWERVLGSERCWLIADELPKIK